MTYSQNRRRSGRKIREVAYVEPSISMAAAFNVILVICTALSFVSAGMTGMFTYQGRIKDGASAADAAIGCVAFGGCFAVLFGFYYLGTRIMPQLQKGERTLPLALFGLLGLLVLAVGALPNIGIIAGPPAAVQEAEAFEANVVDRNAEAQALARKLQASIPTVRNAKNVATGLYEDEWQRGAVCQRGAGDGICASQIRSVRDALAGAETALVNASAEASRVIRASDELIARIAVIKSHDDLSWNEKQGRIVERLQALAALTDQLTQVLPYEVLRDASDALTRDWEQAGFPPIAAAVMTGHFEDVSVRISESALALESVRFNTLTVKEPLKGFPAIWVHAEHVGVQIALALLVDLLGILVVVTMIVVAYARQEDEQPMPIHLRSVDHGEAA